MKRFSYILIGIILGAFIFVPKFRDAIIDVTFGNAIVYICPGDNGVVLNGQLQLTKTTSKNFTAICTEDTNKFKGAIEENSGTTWSEYLSTDEPLSTFDAITEIERFLVQQGWEKSGVGDDGEAYKAEYKNGDKKVILFRYDSNTRNNRMLLITGN